MAGKRVKDCGRKPVEVGFVGKTKMSRRQWCLCIKSISPVFFASCYPLKAKNAGIKIAARMPTIAMIIHTSARIPTNFQKDFW